ncbi:MAG: sigma-54-dependent Fis family transcriptional regulator [Deltaproteobacteria bacterium]|nr:MAG: sigma-54-dependent Fis family transcriptional regulator [Deltaproteobacteria bacterium]
MSNRGHVLLVAGSRSARSGDLADALRHRGFDVSAPPSLADALREIDGGSADAVVIGPDVDHDRALHDCRQVSTRSEVPVILITADAGRETLDAATRAGAFSVLPASSDLSAVDLALDRAVEHSALRREVERLEQAIRDRPGFGALIGSSPPMQQLYDVLERAAQSDVSVLLTGESGTGKELAAREIHRHSRRADGPFVAVNLAAVPDGLLESELFGHARGAFTDARSARRGLFAEAHRGTLFLDEIGELSLPLQPKLLRALQERTVRPVGSDREIEVDVRIITATNRDLDAMVADGRFRQDLYYRLAVVQIETPPLRNRGADILTLAQHFLAAAAARSDRHLGISNAAARSLLRYRWPGNVRELENVIERAVALSHGDRIGLQDLPQRVRGITPEPRPDPRQPPLPPADDLVPMHVIEARYIRRVLDHTDGNKAQAARILGFDRKTLYRKIRLYGLSEE